MSVTGLGPYEIKGGYVSEQRDDPIYTLGKHGPEVHEFESELVIYTPSGAEVRITITATSQDDAVQKFMEAVQQVAALEYHPD